MAENTVLTLAELCMRNVANIADLLDPMVLIELPRTVVVQIAESLHPLDLEKCENSHLFQKLGINTEPLWQRLYCNKWIRQKMIPYCWCPVSELTVRAAKIVWRDQYWYLLFSQVLGEAAHGGLYQQDNWIWKKCLSSCFQKDNHFLQPRSFTIEDFIKLNKKYARCLQLNQKVLCFLMENTYIFELFAEFVEYIKLNSVTESATHDLCKLLSSLFVTKRLKGLGMFFCKLGSQKSWQKIFAINQPSIHCLNSLDCDTFSKRKISRNYVEVKNEYLQQSRSENSPGDLLGVSSADTTDCWCHASDCKGELREGNRKESGIETNDLVTGGEENVKCLKNSLEGSSNDVNDVDIYNFDCIDDTSLHSNIPSNFTSSTAEDSLYDEVYPGNNKSARLVETPVVLKELWKPCHTLAFCSLQHLVLDSTDCFQSSWIELFAEALRFCINLESLKLYGIYEFFSPCSLHHDFHEKLRQLATAIVDIVVTGKLTHVNISIVSNTDIGLFIEYLTSVVGSKCYRCRDRGGMLHSLQLAYNTFISTNVVLKMAQALTNQCCCSQQKVSECCTKNLNSKKEFDNPESSPNLQCVGDQFYGLRELVIDGNASGFDYHENQLTSNYSAQNMAEALSQNSTLVFVKLSGCNFNTDGISTIFRSIAGTNGYKGNKTLKILDLSFNSYRPDQDDGLEMLLRYSTLAELNLAFCHLKILPENVIVALRQNRSMVHLGLAGNKLEDGGVIALSKVFMNEAQDLPLKKINLSTNRVTLRSVTILARALYEWLPKRLEEIDLRDNLLYSSSVEGTISDDNLNVARDKVSLSMLKPLVKTLIVSDVDQHFFSDFVSEM